MCVCVLPWLQLGPVVGRVTPHAAVLLLEVDARCRVRLSLVEPFTGETSVVEHDCVPFVPAVFHFELLRPDRRYLVHVEVWSGVDKCFFLNRQQVCLC